jgi:hypothetical protein
MAGLPTSSGLNNALADTSTEQTTLPSWMDTAQQKVVTNANTAYSGAPSFGDTTAQNAINTLKSSGNPFSNAENALSSIASGAANPWIVNPTTGALTPNTGTALGGLFQAQNDQFNNMLPSTLAQPQAANIQGGNFGSLRGQTAIDNAAVTGLSQLRAQQLQAALQNQQAGVQAGSALGNVGAQDISSNLNTGTAQMNAPYQNATNYANLINSLNVPATVSKQNQMSPLSMLGSIANATGSSGALTSLLGTLGISGLGTKIGKSLMDMFGSSGSYDSQGNLVDSNGQIIRNAGSDTVTGWTTDSLGHTYQNGVETTVPSGYTIDTATGELVRE